METPPRLDDCPPSPPLQEAAAAPGSSEADTRVAQLKKIRDNEGTMCVICWGNVSEKNRCSPENCLHIFCFDCLVKWSRQKNLCPLCKKAFKIIIYNVKSATEYDTYKVVLAPPEPSHSPIDLSDILLDHHHMSLQLNSVFRSVNFITNQAPPRRRFTFQTRFNATLEQNERIQELFGSRTDHDSILNNNYSRLTPAEWRKYIYDRNLYALPLPDDRGRHRECSAAFYRENPATTHRLIPWLNRELVVLMSNTDAIPRILEDMREMLCLHDLQSQEVHNYFRPYIGLRTEHFIHEFLNFAKSPYDIMGYDRIVDYQQRSRGPVSTYEISSTESSDGEIQVVEVDTDAAQSAPIPSTAMQSEIPSDSATVGESPASTVTSESASTSSTVTSAIVQDSPTSPPPSVITPLPPLPPEHTTEVVVETSSAHEQTCTFNDVNASSIAENVPAAQDEVVVESSDSDCEFVLALKPPHLRTPEHVDLNSASDSDVIFVPDTSPKIKEISSDETEDDIPLAESLKKRILKQETAAAAAASSCVSETRLDQNLDELIPQSFLKIILHPNEPSTSTAPRQITNYQLAQPPAAPPERMKKYYEPKRKIVSGKSIFSSSTSSSSSSESSSTTSSEDSDDDWQAQKGKKFIDKRKKTQKRKPSKKLKTAAKLKPLSELPSTGENQAEDDNDELKSNEPSEKRIRSVIIKKNRLTDKHYVDQPSSEDSEQSSHTMEDE